MSVEEKSRELSWAMLIKDMIEKRDLYGRSFTKGVALFMLASDGWLDEDREFELQDMLETYLGDDLIDLMQNRGLHTGARELVHIVDISVLDDIARTLQGENDE